MIQRIVRGLRRRVQLPGERGRDERARSAYIEPIWVKEPPEARAIREATEPSPHSHMLLGAQQGRFLHWLAGAVGATRTIEVGVFTGYSTLWTALALPSDGTIVACEVNEGWPAMGKPHWEAAGVAGKIDLRIGPAVETLQALVDAGESDSYDFAFIDADKASYDRYYELCLQLTRVGGIIVLDNVMWNGRVAHPRNQEVDTVALRKLNSKIGSDPRVDIAFAPVDDGMTVARRLS